MNAQQHRKLARYYKNRYAQIAAYSRSVNGNLTRQQALDYSAIFRKYLDHRQASGFERII